MGKDIKSKKNNIKLIMSALRKVVAVLTKQEDIEPGGDWHKAFVDLKELCDKVGIPYTVGFGEFEKEGPYLNLEDESVIYAGNIDEYVEGFFYFNIHFFKNQI